ncbi:MAG: protease HtpX [Bdellovibrionales bacterium]|nr:protease HtpX [Bdellovibrionales bacterium]
MFNRIFSGFKRYGLLLFINLAMVLTISVVVHLLGLGHWLDAQGINYDALFGLCLIWGFAGAFISLMLSKFMAKRMFGLHMIQPNTTNTTERQLTDMVYKLSRAAGLKKMPEIGMYESNEVNAFATGPSRSNSLVAVSTGLLRRMDADQVEGVLGHEVAHIANGDMVTMTLIQGVMNAFVMFLARVIATVIARNGDRNNNGPSYLVIFLLEMVLGFFAMFAVSYFSRLREYRADKGGARLAGREKMISALKALAGTEESIDSSHKAFASLKISGRGIMKFMSTHPPLSDRIRRLEMGR